MSSRSLRCNIGLPVLALSLAWGIPATFCQAQVTRGFEQTAPAAATFNEAARQRDLWIMEVQFKQVRLAWIKGVDEAGNERLEPIWYMAYRAINRPLSVDVSDPAEPVNEYDPLPGPVQFVPAFHLVTYDDPATAIPVQILRDEVIPEAMEQIRRIEGSAFKDGVSVVQDLPDPVSPDSENQPWIYGVAMWRGVDPETDFFQVILRGFSNGYERASADGSAVSRKVIVQKFKRPGDRFDQNIKEFAFDGEPVWTYQPDRLKSGGNQTASR